MKRLLLAYDGSTCADVALDDLTRAGLPSELEVMVLSVADVWLPANAEDPETEAIARLPLVVRKGRKTALCDLERSHRLAEQACMQLGHTPSTCYATQRSGKLTAFSSAQSRRGTAGLTLWAGWLLRWPIGRIARSRSCGRQTFDTPRTIC